MTFLRWALAFVLLLFGGGFAALFAFSANLRRSFGASQNSPLLIVLPLLAVALLLAGLLWPESKATLHTAAVAAVGLIGFCVWQIVSESATILLGGILYLLLWLVFYWLAAWQSSPSAGHAA